MQRGEIWFAKTKGGDRPVLVLTRDPVADRIGSVVVAALTRTKRGLVSELELSPESDDVPTECVVNFDNLHTNRGTLSEDESVNSRPTDSRRPAEYSGTQPAADRDPNVLSCAPQSGAKRDVRPSVT